MNPNRNWNLPVTDTKCTVCRWEIVIDCSAVRVTLQTHSLVIDTSDLQQWRHQVDKLVNEYSLTFCWTHKRSFMNRVEYSFITNLA